MAKWSKFQGGSLPVFVIVGAVLAVVLIGGLYWLQQYSSEIEQTGEQIAAETDEFVDDVTGPDNEADQQQNKDEQTQQQAEQQRQADQQRQQAQEERAAAKDEETAASNDAASDVAKNESQSSSANEETSQSPEAETLPETGPADTAVQLLGASLLVFAGASYFRSRRSL